MVQELCESTMKLACKRFNTPQGIMIAACDANLLGKKLKVGDLEIEINENFYFERYCSEEELNKLLKEAKIMNLFGENLKEITTKMNLAKEEDFKIIEGIPHIQIYRI